jgi:hypothetical protein
MNFVSLKFLGVSVVLFRKNRAQKEKSHRQYGSGGGIPRLPGL